MRPLHVAVRCGRASSVLTLLAMNARPFELNGAHETCSDIALGTLGWLGKAPSRSYELKISGKEIVSVKVDRSEFEKSSVSSGTRPPTKIRPMPGALRGRPGHTRID